MLWFYYHADSSSGLTNNLLYLVTRAHMHRRQHLVFRHFRKRYYRMVLGFRWRLFCHRTGCDPSVCRFSLIQCTVAHTGCQWLLGYPHSRSHRGSQPGYKLHHGSQPGMCGCYYWLYRNILYCRSLAVGLWRWRDIHSAEPHTYLYHGWYLPGKPLRDGYL